MRTLIIKIAIPIGISLIALLLLLFSWHSGTFASWYAGFVYPVIVHTFGRFFNLFPFSVFELGLVMIPLSLVFFLCMCIFRRKKIRQTLKYAGFSFLYFLSFLFTFFVLNAGINYNRESFAKHVGITVQESSIDELIALYHILVARATVLSSQIAIDENGVFAPSSENFHAEARSAMRLLHNTYGGLVGFYPRPRAPMLSRVMSHMRIGGFFSPWSLEAHYNGEILAHRKPFMMTHELAHVAGHMREDEANFIAYLAARNSSCVDFNYSAVYSGIVYVLGALNRVVDRDTYSELFAMLPMQVRRDMQANRDFWRQFEGPVGDMANRANDAYLRANRQADGVQSYGRMVDLMLAYYRTNNMLYSFTSTNGFRNPAALFAAVVVGSKSPQPLTVG